MRRPRLKCSCTGVDGVYGARRGGARSGRYAIRGEAALFGGLRGARVPERTLIQVGDQLQGAVADLERLVFETPGIGSRCRTEAHDAIALLMEALQRVGRAGVAQERAQAGGSGMAIP